MTTPTPSEQAPIPEGPHEARMQKFGSSLTAQNVRLVVERIADYPEIVAAARALTAPTPPDPTCTELTCPAHGELNRLRAERDEWQAKAEKAWEQGDKDATRIRELRTDLRSALQRESALQAGIAALADGARVTISLDPADCTGSCNDGPCDCSGKFRPRGWDINPDDLRALAGRDSILRATDTEETR